MLADPGAASNWASSAAKAGSPGQAGAGVGAPVVIINEVHVRSADDTEQDFIELRNLGQRRSTSRVGCSAMVAATSSRCPRVPRLAKQACWASGVARAMRTALVPTLALAKGRLSGVV